MRQVVSWTADSHGLGVIDVASEAYRGVSWNCSGPQGSTRSDIWHNFDTQPSTNINDWEICTDLTDPVDLGILVVFLAHRPSGQRHLATRPLVSAFSSWYYVVVKSCPTISRCGTILPGCHDGWWNHDKGNSQPYPVCHADCGESSNTVYAKSCIERLKALVWLPHPVLHRLPLSVF